MTNYEKSHSYCCDFCDCDSCERLWRYFSHEYLNLWLCNPLRIKYNFVSLLYVTYITLKWFCNHFRGHSITLTRFFDWMLFIRRVKRFWGKTFASFNNFVPVKFWKRKICFIECLVVMSCNECLNKSLRCPFQHYPHFMAVWYMEIQSNLTKKTLHRTNQGSNFFGDSSSNLTDQHEQHFTY